MGIPSGVTKFALVGTSPGGEIFNTGFWVNTSYDSETSLGAACDAVSTHFAANYTAIKAMVRADTVYTDVRGYTYPSGGPGADFVSSAAITSGTGTGTSIGILQQAVVVTLLTTMAGRSRKGRMYLPAHGIAIDTTTHQLTTTLTTNIVTAMAGFFNDVNADNTDIIGSVSVVSSRLTSALEVTELRVDTRFDVQRRRANREAITGQSFHSVTP